MRLHRAVIALMAAGALALPAVALATTYRGTVVSHDAAAKTFVLTTAGGKTRTVHVTRQALPADGTRVKASGPVRHGVLQARSVRVERPDPHARHDGADDGPDHDAGDDHGVDAPNHDAGDDHGADGAGHDVGDDHGRHGRDDR
jgi:hypothetical protein